MAMNMMDGKMWLSDLYDHDESYVERFMRERTRLADRLERGEKRAELIADMQAKFVSAKTEEEEDLYIDLQDCLTGWCASHMKL